MACSFIYSFICSNKHNTHNDETRTLASAVSKLFQGCEILECVTWPWPRPFRGQLIMWS